MNHRTGRLLFGFAVGLLVAVFSFQWLVDPKPRAERALQEMVVAAARSLLEATLSAGELEIVDPLATNRKVGKTYIYRTGDGWEVSGYYRRGDDDRWHPYLMLLEDSMALAHLKVQDRDPTLVERAAGQLQLEVVP